MPIQKLIVSSLIFMAVSGLTGLAIAFGDDNVVDEYIDVMPGTSRENNVGEGFGELNREAMILKIHLFADASGYSIRSSDMIDSPNGTLWNKESETLYRAAGVGTNTLIWCEIECELDIDSVGNSGQQGSPPKRWASISDVDLDADTDNDSVANHRHPSKTPQEDLVENLLEGQASANMIGMLLPIDDDNDVSWNERDSYGNPSREKDEELVDLLLNANPKRDGVLMFSRPGGALVDLYDDEGNDERGDQFEHEFARNVFPERLLSLRTAYSTHQYFSGFRKQINVWLDLDEPASAYPTADECYFTIVGVDLDVDTNNDTIIWSVNNPDVSFPASYDDFYEAHPADIAPETHIMGAVVMINNNDSDANGYPDNGRHEDDWIKQPLFCK